MASSLYTKPFFDALLSEGELWSRILHYNDHACQTAPQEWPFSDEAKASLAVWLAEGPRGRGGSGAPATFFWDFSDDSRKLALLEDGPLARLACIAGVTLHAKTLARIVARSERTMLCEALGPVLFDYALLRGQYLVGSSHLLVEQRDTGESLPWRCRMHGWSSLYWCSEPWPEELRASFLRRLTAAAGEAWLPPKETLRTPQWQSLWRMLKKCLIREVDPSWAPYFSA